MLEKEKKKLMTHFAPGKLKIVTDLYSETKKSIVAERKALESNCRDNNDEFKVQGSQSHCDQNQLLIFA